MNTSPFPSSKPAVHLISMVLLLLASPAIAQQTSLRINEFMTKNSSVLTDEDGEYSDWIEIHNPTNTPISTAGLSLSDNPAEPQKWIFPDTTIAAGDYFVVFASGKNKGKVGLNLHTNFKLSGSGEYLGLFSANDGTLSVFDPAYPEQQDNYSFAWNGSNYVINTTPSPGSTNTFNGSVIYPEPEFNHPAGFYETPFQLTISTPYPEAGIYYTTDGSEPGPANGNLYTAPLTISTTTVFRAAVVGNSTTQNVIATQSFLFPQDIINQPNNPTGYPSTWGPYSQMSGTATADYEMDPEITQDPRYAAKIKDALLSIPTMSIVTNKDNLFSKSTDPATGGIYIYTGSPAGNNIGKGWERPASIELINPDGSRGFQADAALELHGGHSRLAEKSPKHSFRISFKSQYGPSKLDYPLFGKDGPEKINSFNLRAGFGNSVHHHAYAERQRWQFVRDIWAKDTQLAMEHPAGHNRYVHLYINGLYWGLYNPTERIDDDFAEFYLGGDETDYDIIKDYGEVASGVSTSWDAMMALAEQGLANINNYQRMLGNNADGTDNPNYEAYVDPENLADYMIINFYGSNQDWDHHNWVAFRNRVNPGKGFKFFSWDAERILEDPNASSMLNEDNEGRPSRLFQRMMENSQFRELFARRVQKHLFNGGVLTPEAATARYLKRANEIEMAVIAESARWGDYRKDVHNHSSGPYNILYTQEHWLATRSNIVNQYFPNRANKLLADLKNKGWFPDIAAPDFHINGQALRHETIISKGDLLSMTAPTGKIYYTLNGKDPRAKSGDPDVNALLYTGPVSLEGSAHILARTLTGTSWSAVSELEFYPPEDLVNLKVTEIHYHPLDKSGISGNLYEFIELKNTGTSFLSLSELQFNEGISYTFPKGTVLEAGQFIVLAASPELFKARYNFEAFGQFEGSLNNGGEELRLAHKTAGQIIFTDYDDQAPWPVKADGDGYSLVPLETNPSGDPASAGYWRASAEIHGSPGKDDPEPVTSLNPEEEKLYFLEQNFPNPFRESTTIRYRISQPGFVRLKVYNLYGKEVNTLVEEHQPIGNYFSSFQAKGIPAGLYFYQLRVGKDLAATKRMVVIR